MSKMMPFAENAFIDYNKVFEYLLNKNHPDGRNKAIFFARMGYGPETAEAFKAMLIKHAQTQTVVKEEKMEYGSKYVIDGFVNGSFKIRTVWIISTNTQIPKLVTAYPI